MSTEKALFEKLQPWLGVERCKTCDCLQGALVQLELDGGEEVAALVSEHKVLSGQIHSCRGCDPCPPAAAWSDYIRKVKSST